MIIRITGWLLMIESLFMLLPTITCLIYDEADIMPFGITAAVTAITGFCLTRYIRPRSHKTGKREGFLLTSIVWIVFSIFGMMPFIFSSTPVSVSDAFF